MSIIKMRHYALHHHLPPLGLHSSLDQQPAQEQQQQQQQQHKQHQQQKQSSQQVSRYNKQKQHQNKHKYKHNLYHRFTVCFILVSLAVVLSSNFIVRVSCFNLLPPPSTWRIPSSSSSSLLSSSLRRRMIVLSSTSSNHAASTLSSSIIANNNNNTTTTTKPPSPRPRQKYGIPVGVVILPITQIQPFKTAIYSAIPHMKKVEHRGVDPYKSIDSGYKMIHLSTEVAAVLSLDDDEDDDEDTDDEDNGDDDDGEREAKKARTTVREDKKAQSILIEFLTACGGEFIPGVRRPKDRRQYRRGGYHIEPQRRCHHHPSTTTTTTNSANESASLLPSSSSSSSNKAKFTFVELFAGIGGFRLGLESIGGKCLLASERDDNACRMYRRHFHNKDDNKTSSSSDDDDPLIECDMIDLTPSDFPSTPDILTGGFPCQPFSTRGSQRGFADYAHRGQMYQELVRMLMDVRPPFFLFENVVGLVTMEGGCASHGTGEHIFKSGKVLDRIIQTLEGCGYNVEWHVVNAGRFVSQYRERVYIVGSLTELNAPAMKWENIYPDENTVDPPPILRDILETDYATNPIIADCELTQRQWDKLQQIHGADTISIARLKTEEYAPTLISSYRVPASSSSRFVMEEADGTQRYGSPYRPRFLSPRECARIMGFPESFDVSPPVQEEIGHVYKGLGNAVVPQVVGAIGREMVRLMGEVDLGKWRDG